MDTVRARHGVPVDGWNCLSGNFKAERNIGAKWENVCAGFTHPGYFTVCFYRIVSRVGLLTCSRATCPGKGQQSCAFSFDRVYKPGREKKGVRNAPLLSASQHHLCNSQWPMSVRRNTKQCSI